MGTKLAKHAYEELIQKNLAWLEKQPRTLEREHIILIVKESVACYYGKEDEIAELKTRAESAERALEAENMGAKAEQGRLNDEIARLERALAEAVRERDEARAERRRAWDALRRLDAIYRADIETDGPYGDRPAWLLSALHDADEHDKRTTKPAEPQP
jgi:Rad3-related DNA helicase